MEPTTQVQDFSLFSISLNIILKPKSEKTNRTRTEIFLYNLYPQSGLLSGRKILPGAGFEKEFFFCYHCATITSQNRIKEGITRES